MYIYNGRNVGQVSTDVLNHLNFPPPPHDTPTPLFDAMEDYDSLIPATHDHDDKKKKATLNMDLTAGNKKSGGGVGGGSGGGSGGGASSLKSCQAEKCTADLNDAKQYHRRHKVCEHHAKAQVVVVGGIRQRFCQQCSRFHELAEFDDTKRSCRRRLAGHNERRRKNSSDPNAQAQGGGTTTTSQSQMKEIVFGQVDNPTFKHFHIR